MPGWLIFIQAPIAAAWRWMRRLIGRREALGTAVPPGQIPKAVIEQLRERYPDAPLPWLEIVARNAPRQEAAPANVAARVEQLREPSAASLAEARFEKPRRPGDRPAQGEGFGLARKARSEAARRGAAPRFVLRSIERLGPRPPIEKSVVSDHDDAARVGGPIDRGWGAAQQARAAGADANDAISTAMETGETRREGRAGDRPAIFFEEGAAPTPAHAAIDEPRFAQERALRARSRAPGVRELNWSSPPRRDALAAPAEPGSPSKAAGPRTPVSETPRMSTLDAARRGERPKLNRSALDTAQSDRSAWDDGPTGGFWSDRPNGDPWPALAEEPAEPAAAPSADRERGRRLARIQEAL